MIFSAYGNCGSRNHRIGAGPSRWSWPSEHIRAGSAGNGPDRRFREIDGYGL